MPRAKTRIIRIGNSQGVRIPRTLLKQAGLAGGEHGTVVGQEVELRVDQGAILLRPVLHARTGWAEQFEQMAASGDDALLDDVPAASTWDAHEWVW